MAKEMVGWLVLLAGFSLLVGGALVHYLGMAPAMLIGQALCLLALGFLLGFRFGGAP